MKLLRYLLFTCVVVFFSQGLWAKTLYVSKIAKGVDNGTAWDDAYFSLLAGLGNAKAGDTIWVAKGEYRPGNSNLSTFTLKEGVVLYGGFAGNETRLDQRDWITNKTTLTGEIGSVLEPSDNCRTVLTIKGQDGIRFDGFEITGGYSISATAGGILIEDCSPVFENCTLKGNYGQGPFTSGGAVTIAGPRKPSSPQFINCRFLDNSCSVIGGAVHNNNKGNHPVFIGCLFANNKAQRGGAIHNGSGTVSTYNCTFSNNEADEGSVTYNVAGNDVYHVNAIVWGNTTNEGGLDMANSGKGNRTVVHHSIVEGGFSGIGNSAFNPQFTSATTYSLQSTSPAIDAADTTGLPKMPLLDLGIGWRVVDRKLDIGAYEYQCADSLASTTLIRNSGCGAYISPQGKRFPRSGTFIYKVPSYRGCDSQITVQVQVNRNDTLLKASSCVNYQLNNKTYTESGTYTQVLTNSKGCDSIVKLQLVVKKVVAEITVNQDTLSASMKGVKYQWIDCADNSTLLGSNERSFVTTKPGDYAVVLTFGMCTDTSDCSTILPNTVPEPIALAYLSIYPNPVQETLQVTFGETGPQQIALTDINGKTWLLGTFSSGSAIDLNTFDPGMYILQVGGYLPVRITIIE